MTGFRLAAASAALLAALAGTIPSAVAQQRSRRVVVADEARPLVVRPAYNAAPAVATGAVVGTAAGVLVANSPGVASALGAGTTIGAGLGFGAIFGTGGLILYCAISKPNQECF
jgi:hypothetical protein